ncbi:MAG: hypothetical protein ACSHX0_02205 [Akkermansiaceae bacterium]
MKSQKPKNPNSADPTRWTPEMEKEDPLWNLLNKASKREPSDFFARNVLRESRRLPAQETFATRIKSFFSPVIGQKKFALSAVAACTCALIALQIWPNGQTAETTLVAHDIEQIDNQSGSTDLSEFIISETLIAAAEDPTLFSHDEVLAMVGF